MLGESQFGIKPNMKIKTWCVFEEIYRHPLSQSVENSFGNFLSLLSILVSVSIPVSIFIFFPFLFSFLFPWRTTCWFSWYTTFWFSSWSLFEFWFGCTSCGLLHHRLPPLHSPSSIFDWFTSLVLDIVLRSLSFHFHHLLLMQETNCFLPHASIFTPTSRIWDQLFPSPYFSFTDKWLSEG